MGPTASGAWAAAAVSRLVAGGTGRTQVSWGAQGPAECVSSVKELALPKVANLDRAASRQHHIFGFQVAMHLRRAGRVWVAGACEEPPLLTPAGTAAADRMDTRPPVDDPLTTWFACRKASPATICRK